MAKIRVYYGIHAGRTYNPDLEYKCGFLGKVTPKLIFKGLVGIIRETGGMVGEEMYSRRK